MLLRSKRIVLCLAGVAVALVPTLSSADAVRAAKPTAPVPLDVDRSISPTDTRPRAEVNVAVNPRNPRHVVVAAIQFGRTYRDALLEGPFLLDNATWVSTDGAKTFEARGGFPPVRRETPASNDPTLAWDPKGPLYASYTGFSNSFRTVPAPDEGLFVARSDDGGRTWRRSKLIEGFACGGPDRSTVAVDPRRGWVYVAWVHYDEGAECDGPDLETATLRWARSVDGGRTFSRPVVIAAPGSGNRVAPAVLADGTFVTMHAVAAGLLQDEPGCEFPTTVIATRWSTSGTLLGRAPALVACDTTAGVSPNGATYNPLSFPTVTADPRSGNLVVALPSIGATGTGVMVARSGDGGRSWDSSLVSGLPGSTASMVALASGTQGRVAMGWLEIEPGGAYRPVLAASVDGGRVWSDPAAVATLPSVGNLRPSTMFDGYGIGHYLGVAVSASNTAYMTWPDLRPDGTDSQDVDVWIRALQLP